jgi:DNA-binding response OmpR family regulator
LTPEAATAKIVSAVRALIVEDDRKIASFLVKGLKQAGWAVDHVLSGEDGFDLALGEPYDVAVIDVMLPGQDGLSLIEQLRRHHVNAPVLILSAKRTVDDRVKGLQAGGDDYLTKPFAFSELLARLQALVRRATGATEPTRLTVGALTIDREFSLLE